MYLHFPEKSRSRGDALGMVFFQMLSSGLWSVSMTTLLR